MSERAAADRELTGLPEDQLSRESAFRRGEIDRGMKVPYDECPFWSDTLEREWRRGWFSEALRRREARHA